MHRAQHLVSAVAIVVGLCAPGCSAVINPDPSLLEPDAAIGNDGAIVPPGDTGTAPTADMGVPGDDGGVPGDDAAVLPGDDAGRDAAVVVVDGGNDAAVLRNDAALACMPGVECTGYADVLAMSSALSTNLANCVVQMHRADCCGARDAYGINHAARTSLCAAEASCDAQYPAASCTDATIHTDDGDSTIRLTDVRLRIANPQPCAFDPTVTCYTCETFVCRTDTCRTAPGVNGGCGP